MEKMTVAVIGLGYVGLPLALAFGRKFSTIGFDISSKRIGQLSMGIDDNDDVESGLFQTATQIEFTDDPSFLRNANFLVVSVPTPVDDANSPDLSVLLSACKMVGENLTRGSTIVFESTVYPGASEEDCVPVIEKFSGLKWKTDFSIGYSPERINPGDRVHTIDKIVKVVAGDTNRSTELIAQVYGRIVPAGIFRASSIKVAEAAKVIENTQRDLNIALINELSKIFSLLGISTYDVLEAASTKWNFLNFKPGLVGGHCIGVDPYYLTYKAEIAGYHPEVILAGRKMNDGMGRYIASAVVKKILKDKTGTHPLVANVLGITFKENVSDIRNSQVVEMIRELQDFGVKVFITDPIANTDEVNQEYDLQLTQMDRLTPADAVIIAVAHEAFKKDFKGNLSRILNSHGTLFDLKGIFCKDPQIASGKYWTL